MKKLLILFLVFTGGCGTQTQKCTKVDPEQAKEVIIGFLYSGNHSDFDELKNLTTSDFLMYGDEGEINFNELVQFIKDWPEPDEYKFDEFDFEIETDCNSAFIHYYYGPDNLHSAYLIRVGNELKINFLHSNRIK